MLDLIKGTLALLGYLAFGPALGIYLRGNRKAQQRLFAFIVFLTSVHITKITLMVHSIEWYRGATKGFEFSVLEILSIALLFSGRNPIGRWWAPGAGLYLLYVAASFLSILHAPEPSYVCMAGTRFVKAVLVYLAAYHFLRTEEDLHVFLKSFAVTMVIQAAVVLKMKYVDHIYQVSGWFEHQNALAMWGYMVGLTLLSVAMGDVTKSQNRWYAAGYGASGIIVQASLSRASLVYFGLGTVAIVFLSLCARVTARKVAFITTFALVGGLGLALTFATIYARFAEDRNKESSELRVLLIQASKLMLRDSAIGIGWNNYALVINKPWEYGDCIDEWTIGKGYTVDPEEKKPQPESHYWLILAENGYPGFFAYLLLIGVTWWWGARCIFTTWGTRWGDFLVGFMIAISITYKHAEIERCLTQPKNLMTWLIFLAFVSRINVWRKHAASLRWQPQHLSAHPAPSLAAAS